MVTLKLSTFNLTLGRLALLILTELLPPICKGVLPVLMYLSEAKSSQVVEGYNSAGFLLS